MDELPGIGLSRSDGAGFSMKSSLVVARKKRLKNACHLPLLDEASKVKTQSDGSFPLMNEARSKHGLMVARPCCQPGQTTGAHPFA
eukprot:279243-Pelagomonas_calceolata.AAC.2